MFDIEGLFTHHNRLVVNMVNWDCLLHGVDPLHPSHGYGQFDNMVLSTEEENDRWNGFG